jgi:Fe-S-cluster containining protein
MRLLLPPHSTIAANRVSVLDMVCRLTGDYTSRMSTHDAGGSSETNDEKWYQDGLKFKCTQCGNCCTGDPGNVWVENEEVQAIAEYLDKPIGEIRLFHTRPVRGRVSLIDFANGDCTFFDPQNRGCTIYPVRPKQCRTWPFWRSNIDTEKDWLETQKHCPGAGQGDFVSLAEIERRATEIEI